jgi:hypothetical protein
VNKPVPVLGKKGKPNIMLVVDKSGSMKESASGTGNACTSDGVFDSPYDARSKNPCKWNDLKAALADTFTGFLTLAKDSANFGLMTYPAGDDGCDAGKVVVPINVSDSANIEKVRDYVVNKVVPSGGTPTALTLLGALQDPVFSKKEVDRDRFAILMTDGVPNCNPGNKASCDQCLANKTKCGACNPTWDPCDSPFSGASCLDESGLVEAVKKLKSGGVDTFVIGFGKDTATSDANRVLNAAADAGGQARKGASTKYYQANNVGDLRKILEDISKIIQSCTFVLDPVPADPSVVQVTKHDNGATGDAADTVLERDKDWRPDPNDRAKINLINQVCTDIQTAPPGKLEIRFSYASDL